MLKTVIPAILGVTLLVAGTAAKATLIGDEVSCSGTNISCDQPTAMVMDPGAEFGLGGGLFDIDIGASTVKITYNQVIFFILAPGFTLSGLDWTDAPNGFIDGFSITTNTTGLDANDVTIGADGHSLSISGFGGGQIGDMFEITLDVVHVPEPGTLALFGLGLAGLGFARRRKTA